MNEIKKKLDLNELEAVVGGVLSTGDGGPFSQSVSNLEDLSTGTKPSGRTSVNNYGINDDDIK